MKKNLNLLLFSGSYDKALAALILADSAKDLDIDVTIFCAFWGLCLIRDPEKTASEDKSVYEKMFETMTPKGAEELPLSKMNFAGIGKKMLSEMMAEAKAPSVEDLLQEARNKGVKFYACQLSVNVMGFTKEELIPEATIVDATTYLRDALEADLQLFI